MTAVVAGISIIGYLLALFKFKKQWTTQQMILLFIYLIGLTATSLMDVVLPIYFIFSFLPFIPGLRKISRTTFLLAVYFGIYLLLGLTFQDKVASIVTFVAKSWQFLIFFIVYDCQREIQDDSSKGQIVAAVIVESLLGLYLLGNSTRMDANGMVRLVSGAQPISGNIAVVMLPLSVYLYFKHRDDAKYSFRIILLSLIFLVWIILSGTRGYTLMYVMTMFFVFYDYLINHRGRNETMARNRAFVGIILFVVAVSVILLAPSIVERLNSILRIGSSVGIRTYENAAEIQFFKKAPWHVQIFGIGIGGTAGKYEAFRDAIGVQASLGMWNLRHYLNDAGNLYHNLFADILLNFGVIGIVVIVIVNVAIWRRVTFCCSSNIMLRRTFHLYQLSFLWMNYYRWSGDCGIAEMIMFALVLRYVSGGYLENEPGIERDRSYL